MVTAKSASYIAAPASIRDALPDAGTGTLRGRYAAHAGRLRAKTGSIRGVGALSPRNAAVLRDLFIWREDAARRHDRPPRSFVKDEILLDQIVKSGDMTEKNVQWQYHRSVPQLPSPLVYGGVLWGVLPGQPGVSWQGHLFGAVAGVLAAVAVSDRGPLHARRR